MFSRTVLLSALLATVTLAVPGCSEGVGEGDVVEEDADAEADEAEEAATEEEAPEFDPDKLPMTDVRLGEFPFFHLPEGYHTKPKNESTQALGQFAFWNGNDYIGANGRIYQGNIQAVDGKVFSSPELTLALEKQILGKGGVLIADGVVPSGARAAVLTREFTAEYNKGLCWPTEPVRTYVVRDARRHVWVHACTYGDIGGGWVIAEIPVEAQEQAALSAQALAERLEKGGEVRLGLTYKAGAEVADDADAQVAEVVRYMDRNPDAALTLRGSAGPGLSAGERGALGQARAQHVYNALTAAGVAGARLQVTTTSEQDVAGVSIAYAPADEGEP
ncbi:hypothetical protein FKV24_018290 [Lysobacter maris]|uniref:OmpA family protein n=2 Tax=Marilutibacter maris TaxID=1605891 RepID=A0A507ZRJ5_9GAMM|nr:hypothetical protein [Lysobacter maris]KAB8162443.1 hypothetical protein FKV24_018290 [Lysobacter maris]